jgi:K(+)-stimulated pyrophosphate-energized sodium pump
MSNSGGLWDNSKKYVESGNHGGKGSDAHKAAVVGDTVGDPFKDTAGPSLNTQVTVVSLVASLMATLFLKFNLLDWLNTLIK